MQSLWPKKLASQNRWKTASRHRARRYLRNLGDNWPDNKDHDNNPPDAQAPGGRGYSCLETGVNHLTARKAEARRQPVTPARSRRIRPSHWRPMMAPIASTPARHAGQARYRRLPFRKLAHLAPDLANGRANNRRRRPRSPSWPAHLRPEQTAPFAHSPAWGGAAITPATPSSAQLAPTPENPSNPRAVRHSRLASAHVRIKKQARPKQPRLQTSLPAAPDKPGSAADQASTRRNSRQIGNTTLDAPEPARPAVFDVLT